MKTINRGFLFSIMTCVVALLVLGVLTSSVSLAAQPAKSRQQDVQKPLLLVFTATFAPKVGEGPSMQYEFQADTFLGATKIAQDWGKEYCPQNILVSLIPYPMDPQETYVAIFAPKVGEGPTMQYEFQVGGGPSAQSGLQADSFVRAFRVALGWGDEYCPQNILVSFMPKSQPDETNATPQAAPGIKQVALVTLGQHVFNASFVSRDTGLVMRQQVQAHTFLRAVKQTLAWSKVHSPEYVLFSVVQE